MILYNFQLKNMSSAHRGSQYGERARIEGLWGSAPGRVTM